VFRPAKRSWNPEKGGLAVFRLQGERRIPVGFRVEEVETDGSSLYFLRLERPTRLEERYELEHRGQKVVVAVEEEMALPSSLKLEVNVSAEGYLNSRVALPKPQEKYSSLYLYTAFFDGEERERSRGSSSYFEICEGLPENALGWHEFAVEASQVGEKSARVQAVVDVWVDCEKAKLGRHPSVVKSVKEWFVADVAE
jgi:hypothetical protein